MTTMYELAREAYAKQGIDTEAVIETLANKAISMHCWQGDDVVGFDQGDDNAASGGIMTTGNYPGRAATPRTAHGRLREGSKPDPRQEAH